MRENVAQTGKQGFWYVFAGASAALLELGLFELLLEIVGLGVAPSNILATVTATAYNFMFNRNITFKSTSNPVRSAILYCVLFLVNMGVSTLVISLLIQHGIPPVIAKAGMQVCVVAWNFVIYKKIIFV